MAYLLLHIPSMHLSLSTGATLANLHPQSISLMSMSPTDDSYRESKLLYLAVSYADKKYNSDTDKTDVIPTRTIQITIRGKFLPSEAKIMKVVYIQ